MDNVFIWIKQAHLGQVQHPEKPGPYLARTITPESAASDPGYLQRLVASMAGRNVERDTRNAFNDPLLGFNKERKAAWQAVYLAYFRVAEAIVRQDAWADVYKLWKDVVNSLIQGFSKSCFEAWHLPYLYMASKWLRVFALRADQAARERGAIPAANSFSDDIASGVEENENLEDAARQVNRIFSLCISDRSPIENSRKWAIYGIANAMFKIYFRLDAISLAKNILRSIGASANDMPPFETFPAAHKVTYSYYVGIVSFLDEDYQTAAKHLNSAFARSPRAYAQHRALILSYLIPCQLMLHRKLPSAALLAPYPLLQRLFGPLMACIKRGDLGGFDAALEEAQDELVRRRIYLTLERARDLCLRNALRKVFIAAGFEDAKEAGVGPTRRTRIRVEEFQAGLQLSLSEADAAELDRDEVECLLANMVYKGYMKGYISRERGIVVLSKGGQAFPGTGL